MSLPLSELTGIAKGVTAVIGSGGKSALIRQIARELPGKVLICSTCYYYPYRDTAFLSLSDLTPEKEIEKLSALLSENRIVCAGVMVGNGKLGPPAADFARLKQLADYVLVEADDARGLPLKAHGEKEPVLPDTLDHVLAVIGAQGFMQPVEAVVHRADVFCLLTGCTPDSPAKPELVARAFLNERLTKRIVINQVESRLALAYAERFVNATDCKNIIVGSVQNNAYKRYL